jgi:AmmeMemoRadiSam system protein B
VTRVKFLLTLVRFRPAAGLSLYLDQLSPKRSDRHTAQAVVDRDAAAISPYDACGAFALRGLVHGACRYELDVRPLHLGTSADAGGDRRRVVGYAAFALPSTRSQRTVTGG